MTAPVQVRKYESMAEFQQGAASWTAAGWKIVAQSSGSRMSSAGAWCAALGIFGFLAGFVWFPLFVVGVVMVLIGAGSRETTYTVTYVPQT